MKVQSHMRVIAASSLLCWVGFVSAIENDQVEQVKKAIQAVVQDQLDQEVMNAVSEQVTAEEALGSLESGSNMESNNWFDDMQSTVDDAIGVSPAGEAAGSLSSDSEKASSSQADDKEQKTVAKLKNDESPVKQEGGVTALEPHEAERIVLPTDSRQSNQRQGWMYIGQYVGSEWKESILQISNQLPIEGQAYGVATAVYVRDNPPSEKGMSNIVASLGKDDQIKVLSVKPSGRKGHYWALVER